MKRCIERYLQVTCEPPMNVEKRRAEQAVGSRPEEHEDMSFGAVMVLLMGLLLLLLCFGSDQAGH